METIGGELLGDWKWIGAFTGPDGCVYGIARYDKLLLRIDPFDRTVGRVGASLREEDQNKLARHATAADGTVWALPCKCPVAPHHVELPPPPPFGALAATLADDTALAAALACDVLRWPCVRLLAAALGCPDPCAERHTLAELARTKPHPAFAAAAARSQWRPFSVDGGSSGGA